SEDARRQGTPAHQDAAESEKEEPIVDVSPVSFWITIAGAVVMLIAIFLEQFEVDTFAPIQKNTLIQNGDGRLFIGVAIGTAGAAWRAYERMRRTVPPSASSTTSDTLALGSLAATLHNGKGDHE